MKTKYLLIGAGISNLTFANYVKDDYMKDNVFKKEATNEPYTSETDTSIDSEYLKPSEECKIGKYTSNG